MKKLCLLLIILPYFGLAQTFFGPHVTMGYNSGFHSDIGLDLSFIKTGGGISDLLKNYRAVQNFIGVEYDKIGGKNIYGPKYRLAGHYTAFSLGLDLAYLKASTETDWYFVCRPQVGIAILTIFSLNYSYNLSNAISLYPSDYSPHGFSIGLTYPLHDGNGWR